MSNLWRDLRQASRALRRERAFSATVLATLAVVIGANVAIFSVIYAVLLAPLPYANPEELVTLYNQYPGAGVERGSNGAFDYFARRERVEGLAEVALFQNSGSTVGDPGSTERVSTVRVTPSLFPLLGVNAALGRTFTEDEMEPGNQYKVLLTDGFWREYFSADPNIVGQDMRIDGRPYTVVGVVPADFSLAGLEEARYFLPLSFTPEQRSIESWHSNSWSMLGRLRPGVTIQQVQSQVDALNEALVQEWPFPGAEQLIRDVGFRTAVFSTEEDLVADIRPTLMLLWAGVGFVLLIGCVNIANLMLGRSQRRLAEVATRLALGAPRRSVVRQVITESLVLSVLGGALGVAGGFVGLRLLAGLGLDGLPRGTDVGINANVVLFTVVLAVVTGILFAAAPIAEVLRRDLSNVFRSESRSTTSGRGSVLFRNGLVTAQVALAFVLLIGAGLMLMSFRAALSIDPGFVSENLGTAFISLPSVRYEDDQAQRSFLDRTLREIEALPGVEAASYTTQLPFSGNNSSSVVLPEGYMPPPGESIVSPFQSLVGPEYFRTMGIRLIEGRPIEWTDGPEQTQVMLVDQALARRYWPDTSPIGNRMLVGQVPGSDQIDEDDYFTVVGVVETIKQNDLTTPDADQVGAYYRPARQYPQSYNSLVVRPRDGVSTTSIMASVREVVQRVDPELPLFDVQTMDDRINESLANRRTPMTLLLVFAGVALFLAVIGIYGSLAYSVSRRRQEMGIRMALGGDTGSIFKLILGHGVKVAAVGVALGFLASLGLTTLVQTLLFGVQPLDPMVMASVATVLGASAIAACILPALNATRVDPVNALAPE